MKEDHIITSNKINKMIKRIQKLLSRFGVGYGKRLTLNEATNYNFNMNSLHLGCGNIHIKGYCNVDDIPTGSTDLILDIASLPGIKNDSIGKIYSCHVLEHFSTGMIDSILARWYQVLLPGGELRISVPDLDAITRIYQKNIKHFQTPGNQPWVALIYGGQKDIYDFHKTGFNYCWMKYLLENAGFENIQSYEHTPHFIPGVIDNSQAMDPFGEYISLNVLATKPKVLS
jgi:predicted SAM-dependent methyltransferase